MCAVTQISLSLGLGQPGPLPRWGAHPPASLVIGFLPSWSFAGTAVFSALALCLYLGQAVLTPLGLVLGCDRLPGRTQQKHGVGSAQLGC